MVVPAIAMAAFVYYAHQVIALLRGDEGVAYPSLAVVILIQSTVVLSVQAVVLLEGFVRT
jgi:hypothetical protein